MSTKYTTNYPRRKQHLAYCTSNKSGNCLLLTDTDFGKKPCPFYADKRKNPKENAK